MSTVNDILANLQQLALAIESVYTNFKKEGASSKTPVYAKKRLDILDSYWVEYESNYSKLSAGDLDPARRDYLNSELEKVQERYGNIRAHIQSYQAMTEERAKSPLIKPPSFVQNPNESTQSTLQPSSTRTSSHNATVGALDGMLKKQQSNFKAFHRTVTGIDLESVNEKWEFEDLLHTVQSRWAAIDSLHWELDSQFNEPNEEYEKTFSSYESKYQSVKKTINKKMWSMVHREKSTPQMEIPTFNGNYNTWVSFKDLFNETVHSNSSLSNAQKMQYLKSKVKGEAERLIQHLNISSDNYIICWDILNQRYNNKKLIFSSHMNVLMSLPTMQHQSAGHLKRIHDTIQECLNAIKNLGVDITSWDPIIIHLLTQKLDTVSYTDYMESVQDPREIPNLKEFLQFLESKFTSLEASRRKQDIPAQKFHNHSTNKNDFNNSSKQRPSYYKNSFASSKVVSQIPINKKGVSAKCYYCALCNSTEHGIYFCPQFLEMPAHNKLKTVTRLNLCQNCLYDHRGQPCLSEKFCRVCNKAHNRLLHEAFVHPARLTAQYTRSGQNSNAREGNTAHGSAATEATVADTGRQVRSSSHVSLQGDQFEVLLPTALVNIQAADGTYYVMRALLDQGSQTSLITEHAAQILKIPRMACKGVISGIGDKESNCKGIITISCSSAVSDFTFKTDALIMNQLIRNLPSYTFSKPDWSYLKNIKLADPEFYKSRPVDILLGADIYSIILMDGMCRSENNLPTAQQTQLGWILSGNVRTIQCNVVLHNIEQIQKFWEIEDISEKSEVSSEDEQCLQFYQSTTIRRPDGSYEVRLPLKSGYESQLGHSKSKAVAQFYRLEQKLKNNPSTAAEYKQFINEYLSLNHMTLSTDDCNKTLTCYLPHHCVTREDSTTTKLRVVFNASNKTQSGYSLNDVMCRGPNLQQDLQCLIIKWRQYEFAFTADIEKMFRQIWVNKEDRNLQMILWRDDQNKKLQEYFLATITYGTKAAPFLAMMTLRRLANDEKINYPDSAAPAVLEESFYMDDLIHGTHSVQSAKQLQADIIKLLKAGGFNLRKWKSNCPEILKNVNEAVNSNQENFDFKQAESTKALGLGWEPQQDNFTFQSKLTKLSKLTKRALLSEISKLFDPLGWLSPLTTKLKILFQDIWKAKLQWDDLVPQNILEEWNKIKTDISIINQLKLPRWLHTKENDRVELHGFCDASTKAYGCVIYCKINRADGNSVSLVAGKTKLVPLSQNVSLPRLELCGAVLLSKLMIKIKGCLSDHDVTEYGWTDSMVVLGWLHGETERWKPFVANRVKQVTASMPKTCWRYIKSSENPADCASRGLTATQLKEHSLWWNGPSWLSTYQPIEAEKEIKFSTDQDVRKIKSVYSAQTQNQPELVNEILTKYSSLSKAIRVLSWIRRFIYRNSKSSYLSINEIKQTKLLIIKQVQTDEFSEEIDILKRGKYISSSSKLYNLNPMLDDSGVLRLTGRLRHANIDPEMKHPIIIPSKTRLADLTIDEAHILTFHGGPRLTTAFMRQRYWMIGGIRAVKQRLRLCVVCRKQSPSLQHQFMGDLPAARTEPSRPFYHCGVDYTGHVYIKANQGRGIKTTKGYIAVFVCMATKAVHLELVSSLTTSAFLAALRRMAARRGLPRHMYSDQGKNFIGADRVLREELSEISESISPECTAEVENMGIEWHFNAPSWPSAGGLWERAIRSLKHHLKRVINDQKLTYEEFTTLLAQLEGCLNSRPLCPLTEDPDDLNFLTPSHFLSSGPVLTLYDTEKDLRTRWNHTQKIFYDLWSRWRKEYLTQLMLRSKWRKPETNIKLNEVVIIKDDNLPPGQWSLGRVVELHPGSDGYVRVVTLKTKNGLMKRPVVKLATLPVLEEQKQENKHHENKSEKPKSRATEKKGTKKYSLATIFTSLLFFFTTLQPAHCFYNVTPIQGTNSIYFDRIKDMQLIRDDWRLVVYYDIQPYQDGYTALNKYIQYLDNLCVILNKQSHCDGVLLQLRHEATELQYYNDLLINHHVNKRRRRRGLLNGVGNLANTLFGVLDDNFAKKYEQDIQLIKENENHLASLWKNQTSIVEAEFNILKRMETVANQQQKRIHKKITILETAVNQAKSEFQIDSDFLSTAMITNNILFSLRNIQQTLLDAVTNVYNGRFNFHLIPPDQLKRELSVISEQIPKDLTLPITKSDRLIAIYNLLQVRARVTPRFIIFEIKIPLIGVEVYEVLKLIPIPRVVDNNKEISVVPVSEYVAVNLNNDAYIKLTQTDLSSCVQSSSRMTLCHLKTSIYTIKDDQDFCETLPNSRKCKTISETCNNRWVELNKINKYFFFCCDKCQLKIICADHISPLQISKAGFFNIDQGCTIKTINSLVYSHRQSGNQIKLSSNIQTPEISQINHIINISLPEPELKQKDNFEISNRTIELQEIEKNIEIMKKEEPLISRISSHDVHHYVAIYVLFALLGLGAALWAGRRCSRRTRKPAPARAEPVVEFITTAIPAPSTSQQCSDQCSAVSELVNDHVRRYRNKDSDNY